MLHLLISRDWVSIRNEILNRVAQDIAAGQNGRILMVPELISHDMERRLCQCGGDTASRYAEVMSFSGLARRVSDCAGSGAMECMDEGGRLVAMAAAARNLHSQLKAYASVETKPEFLLRMIDAVDEFKRCCISPEDLRIAAGMLEGVLAQKLEELALLYSAYDSVCSRGKRDPRDEMNWLLEQLQDGDFAQNHVFYIDGFPDYTVQHMRILEHLICTSPSVTVGVNCDRLDATSLAFEKAGSTARQIYQIARQAGVDVQIEGIPGRDDPMMHAWESLFQGTLPEALPDRLHALQADSPAAEVQLAAAGVLKLVQNGCRYRDIGIVCSDLQSYQHYLQLQFDRSHIPSYQSGKEDILQKSVIATVLSALDAALGGFDQKNVLRYLKSALSPLELDVCDCVENYAIVWAVKGKQWLSQWKNHPDGLTGIWTDSAEKRLELLENARKRVIEPLAKLRESFLAAHNLGQQVRALYDFLEDIHLDRQLSQLANAMELEGDSRSAQILNQLWEILLSAMEQLYDVLGETVWDPETFVRLFTLLLSQYDVGTIPPVLDAVTVGTVSSMRCQQLKHLFILGACEGSLPGYTGAEGILSDQERETLRKVGVTLTGGAMDGVLAEFAEIYGVLCGASESVTLSYPGGQASYLYRRFAKLAGGEVLYQDTPEQAITDQEDAVACLVGLKAREIAHTLNLSDLYAQMEKRIEFSLGKLTPEQVRRLYGESLNLSASQIDKQADCAMAYFMKYGLRAKERAEATADPAEFGTYVHAVLENTAREVMELGGFHQVSLEQTMQIAQKYSDTYTQERFSQIDSGRILYLFRRNKQELEMVVTELWRELKDSGFAPAEFELGFGSGKEMDAICIPSHTMPAALQGFVDRVDIWKKGDQTYFRVVDYKTGKKDFDYCDVFNGVGLQMLLYLFALEELGEPIIGQNPVAAGVQYFPARVPLISVDNGLVDAEAEQLRLKEWKRKGLLLQDMTVLQAMEPGENFQRLCAAVKKDGSLSGDLADQAQFRLLRTYIFDLLGKMVDRIASGNVTPDPYTRGTSHNACAFCPYGAVCHKDSVEDRRNYKAMPAQRFWEEIEREVQDHG